MTIPAKLIALAPPIVLLLLTAVAGVAYARITSLSLPIPKALALFTVVLPLITGVSTHGTSVLVRRAGKKEQAQLTLPLLAVIGFQLLYETIVATLAVTHIIPPSDLLCGLEKKWYQLYRAKDRTAIKAIQDSLNCCGFNSVKDKSWPFVDPATCSDVFGRSNSCVGAWRQAEQTNAGLLLIVALVVFLVTVLTVISLLTNSTWTRPRWAITEVSDEDPEDGGRAAVRRLIEQGDAVSPFHDSVEEDNSRFIEPASNGQQPRVQPSQLVDPGNEWARE